jgi:hypothetical protein
MPPSVAGRSEHSYHSGYSGRGDDASMMEDALDRADRASHRLEVRPHVPIRISCIFCVRHVGHISSPRDPRSGLYASKDRRSLRRASAYHHRH